MQNLGIAQRIALSLQKQGYYPATLFRTPATPSSLLKSKEVGILWDNPEAPQRTYLWGLISVPALCQFLAIVWIDNPRRGATSNRLVIGYYGSENVWRAQEIANYLERELKISTSLLLEDYNVPSEALNWGLIGLWPHY